MTKYNDNGSRASESTKKFLNDSGLSHVFSLITSFVRNYASPKTHNHDGVYAKSSHTHTTSQVTGLDSALAGKAPTSHTHTIAQVTNLQSSLDSKTPNSRKVNGKPLSTDITLTSADVKADAAGSATNALNSAKQYTDTVAAGKAAKSHIHDATNITTGTLSQDRLPLVPVSKGGTGKTNGKDAANYLINALEEGTSTPTDADKILTQYVGGGTTNTTYVRRPLSTLWSYIKPKCDAVYQAKGSYAAASHTHAISNITNLQAQLDGKQAKGSYAASSHTHTISNVTNLQTELDKKQVKIQPVTTAGTGSAYTATVPHIKALTAGMKFTMVPHVVSADVSPTLNVNNLGAKAIRQRLSNGTVSTATGATANWLAAGKPVDVMYDGQFWVVDFVRPNMASAYGVLPVVNGGTGANTAEQARQNLGITPSNIGAANAVQLVKIESMLKCADIEGLTQYTTNSAFTMGVSNPSISGIGCYAKFYCTLYVMPPSTTSFPKGTVIGHFRIKGIYNHIIVENNNSNFATIANPSCDDASTDIQVVLNKPWSPGGSYGSSAINATLCYK